MHKHWKMLDCSCVLDIDVEHGDAQRYGKPLGKADMLDSLPQVPHAARGWSACRSRPSIWGATSTDLCITLEQ
jgi:hypothetical protein